MGSFWRSVLVLALSAAGCRSNDSVFASANLPQSIEFGGERFQSYLATMVFPIRAHASSDKSFGGGFRIPGLRVQIFPAGPDTPDDRSACDVVHMAAVTDVRREVLSDGHIVSCREAGGLAVSRMVRIDDRKLYCEIVTHEPVSDTDLVIATNMCKSLHLAWHADNHPRRFRFPCHGELTFGRNKAGEGTWLTHLDCPPESQGLE